MKNILWLTIFIFVAIVFCGCEPIGEGELFVVDFPKTPLVYRMVAQSKISVDLDPKKLMSKGSKSSAKNFSEKLEMIVEYSLVDVADDGYTVEIYYKSVNATKKGFSKSTSDSVKSIVGKKIQIKMTPAGFVTDDSQLRGLIKEAGDKSFAGKQGKGAPVKSHDMIPDFVALQWYMWDAMSKIPEPMDGVKVGQSWQSQLSAPMPMGVAFSRDTTYTLDEINDGIASVSSSYAVTSGKPKGYPDHYSKRSYRQRGFFGVLKCKPLSLAGSGKIKYDLERGLLIKDSQQYDIETTAVLFLPLPGTENGRMKINQSITIELVQ